jgi:hypothetical protein
MKLSESWVVCALVASLGSAGAAEADDFKELYARADLGGSMRGTALMGSSSTIKEQKSLARDKPPKKEMQFNSVPHSDACAEVKFDECILTPLQFFAECSALLTTARRDLIDAGASQFQIGAT